MRLGTGVALGNVAALYAALSSIPGLVAIWDPTLGRTMNGGNLATWTDTVSGFAPTQSNPAKQPLYNATDAAFGGRASVQFDGTDFLSVANANVYLDTAGNGYTILYAVKWTTLIENYQFILSNFTAGVKGVEVGALLSTSRASNHVTVSTGTDGAPQTTTAEIVAHRWTQGSAAQINVNGVDQVVSSAPTTMGAGASAATLTLGARSDGSLGAAARVGMIVCYNRGLTAAELRAASRRMGRVVTISVA